MKITPFIFILFFFYSSVLTSQIITLEKFETNDKDSILLCKVVERYESLVDYINSYVDHNTDPEDRRKYHIAIYRLMADDIYDKSNFGIQDESLEGKKNKYYRRSDYLSLLDNLIKFNYVYQKEFLDYSCPLPIANQSTMQNTSPIKYDFPLQRFGFRYIENSVKSDTVSSSLRKGQKFGFNKFLVEKEMAGRFSKLIQPDRFYQDSSDYSSLLDQRSKLYSPDKGILFDKRNTNKVEKLDSINKELKILERSFVKFSIKFLSVSENPIKNLTKKINEYKESSSCACETTSNFIDDDNDGYPYPVDCNDADSLVYPGARIIPNYEYYDCNCDGIEDLNCIDKDGDGFYDEKDCDCSTDSSSTALQSKCDCNDLDSLVYPGASIDCTNGYDDDNCDGIPDNQQIQRGQEIELSTKDNLYPPYGLTNFAKDKRFYIYSGLMLAGISSSIYYKVQSNKYYTRYENAETFRIQGSNFTKANNNHKRFVVSAAFTAGVYLTSFIDLKIRFAKYNKIRNEINQRNSGCALIYDIELNPIDLTSVGVGPSLKMRF